MARSTPTEADHRRVIELVLGGIGDGADFDDLVGAVRPFHPERNTFPAEVLVELAADALSLAGVGRTEPVHVGELINHWPVRVVGRTHQAKRDYVVRTVAMIHAGIEPDLLEETGWWRVSDLWLHSLAALRACIDVAADRLRSDASTVCSQLRR